MQQLLVIPTLGDGSLMIQTTVTLAIVLIMLSLRLTESDNSCYSNVSSLSLKLKSVI